MKLLYQSSSDNLIKKYNGDDLKKIMEDPAYHSPEESEISEGEDEDNRINIQKKPIYVFDISWRSEEVILKLKL
jgi:hypothetical protein